MDARAFLAILLIVFIANASAERADEGRVVMYRLAKPPGEAAECMARNLGQSRESPYSSTVRLIKNRMAEFVVRTNANGATIATARLIPVDAYSLMRIRFTGRQFGTRSAIDALLRGC